MAVVLRAFASGCTALTGVEAVSNGVPNFKKPKARNAASTLAIMGGLTIAMFVGITALALMTHVHVAADASQLVGAPEGYTQRTVIAQIAAAVFGNNSVGFFAVQAFTAAILVLAANTAFNGFPILASILGQDGFLPRQFARRGDRLVFSNGIVILSLFAIALIVAFNASTTRLIQLYIIGVFVSFTLSQSGMVKHWRTLMRLNDNRDALHRMRVSMTINAVGAVDHRGGARHRAAHQVHPRRLDRRHHHAAGLPADDRHPPALRRRRGRADPQARRRAAAQPHPRHRARLQAQHPGAAGAGVCPGHPPEHPDRAHRAHQRPRRPRRCAGTGSSSTSRCR